MSFKGRVIKSSLWSLAGGSGQQLIGLFIFLYLAKILDARAVGIIASAAILSDITVVVSRMGIMESIQRHSSNAEVDSAAFWFTALTGFSGTALLLLSALLIHLWGDPLGIAAVLLILAPMSALSATAAVPEGIIRRGLNFRALTVRTWIATIIGGVVAVVMVRMGFGLYALAGQRLATAMGSFVMIWAQSGWYPKHGPSLNPAKDTIKTGAMILVGNFSGIINSRISDSITALFLGPIVLGFMRVGSRFWDVMVQMTVIPVTGVALPSFSMLREDSDALRRMYLRLTQFMAAASIPVFFGIGSVAPQFISILLGDKWLGAVPVFELMGFLITAGSINYFFSPLIVSIGRADIVMKQSVAQIILGVPLIWIGSHFGMFGVLIANIVRASIVSIANLAVINSKVGLNYKFVLWKIVPPFISSLIMFISVKLIMELLAAQDVYIQLLVGVFSGAVIYSALMVAGDIAGLWPHYVRGAVGALRDGLKAR